MDFNTICYGNYGNNTDIKKKKIKNLIFKSEIILLNTFKFIYLTSHDFHNSINFILYAIFNFKFTILIDLYNNNYSMSLFLIFIELISKTTKMI